MQGHAASAITQLSRSRDVARRSKDSESLSLAESSAVWRFKMLCSWCHFDVRLWLQRGDLFGEGHGAAEDRSRGSSGELARELVWLRWRDHGRSERMGGGKGSRKSDFGSQVVWLRPPKRPEKGRVPPLQHDCLVAKFDDFILYGLVSFQALETCRSSVLSRRKPRSSGRTAKSG